MIKVVIDANVFISALLTPGGTAARVLDLARQRAFDLLLSPPILREWRRVLQYPKLKKRHGLTPDELEAFLQDWISLATLTPGKKKVRVVKDDPEDDKYLACALEGQVDFIVWGSALEGPGGF
jgi:hypothetical protein